VLCARAGSHLRTRESANTLDLNAVPAAQGMDASTVWSIRAMAPDVQVLVARWRWRRCGGCRRIADRGASEARERALRWDAKLKPSRFARLLRRSSASEAVAGRCKFRRFALDDYCQDRPVLSFADHSKRIQSASARCIGAMCGKSGNSEKTLMTFEVMTGWRRNSPSYHHGPDRG